MRTAGKQLEPGPFNWEDFTNAIQLAPKDAEAYMGRAGLYRAMNDEKKAIADWKKAAELGNEDAHWLLQEKEIE